MTRAKLMIVSSSHGEGGAQRVQQTLLAHVDRARFAPSLCVFKPTITYPVPDDVPVHVLGRARDEPLAVLARRRPWLVGELLAALRRRIQIDRPDVIVSMIDQVSSVTATAMVGMSRRPRWIARIASDPVHQGAVAAAWAGWALRRADAIVVSSAELGDGVARKYPHTAARLSFLANLTDFPRVDVLAAAAPARTRDPTRPLLVAVGRLSREKRPDLMLEAVARLRRPLQLWLVGDGPLADDVARRVRDLGLGGTVEVLGFCDNPYALMRQADVFLISSDFEGQPNSLIEAQGLGVAAVSTNCDFGPRDVIADGATGLLVPCGSADALAGAIAQLLDDPARRATMAAAARERARAQYGVASLIRAWERVLTGEG